jgi:hypothetical protein
VNDPSYAGLYIQLSEIQFLRDIAVVQTLTHCAINRTQTPVRSQEQRISYLPIYEARPVRAARRTTGLSCQTWSLVHLDLTILRELTPEAEASVLLDRYR